VGSKALDAQAIREIRRDRLRRVGLSKQKATYLHDLAARVADGAVDLDSIHERDDESVIEHLVQVKGIGRWTAEMFLIFCLGRPDVLPVDDFGLRAALRLCDGLPELPTRAEVRERGAVWAPYRSVATWYLWQSLKVAPDVTAK
jgi:DNA-3-methyladenine glycosylase II